MIELFAVYESMDGEGNEDTGDGELYEGLAELAVDDELDAFIREGEEVLSGEDTVKSRPPVLSVLDCFVDSMFV